MFNNQLKKDIKDILEKLGIEARRTYGKMVLIIEGGELGDMKDRIRKLEKKIDRLYVDNYFSDCPCCEGKDEILKSEAKKFEKIIEVPKYNLSATILGEMETEKKLVEHYTTEEQYEVHKGRIEEWEKDVKKYK